MRRGFARDARGITSVEFAMVALPLTMFLFGVVEVGLAVRARSALQYATAQTARCSVVDSAQCGTVENAKAYAMTQTMGVAVPDTAFSVTTEACGRQVTATLPFPVVAHHVFPVPLTLRAQSCYPL
jgi:Flp pilus assembly protein TadG